MNDQAIQQEVTEITISDPGKALRPLHKQTKLTRKKKLQFLSYLAEEFNLSQAAAKVGVHRKAINYLMIHDPQFKEAIQDMRDGWLDKSEGIGFKVAIQPTRDGFNDRKLFLSAHREEYKQKPMIQLNQQFNYNEGEMDSVLTRILPDDT